ncbi:nuclear transport factor 2 family protein [Actinobacillus vicugnae]|nr:nuclear transport factor 2 family protein [Actinobacillus vicugnae]
MRYTDEFVKENGKWLIAKRVAEFLISETRLLG